MDQNTTTRAGSFAAPPRSPRDLGRLALWFSLLPLLLLLRPYPGLVEDARIYIGRGLADRDPAGVGRDIMFANDGQTGFSIMRAIIRALLGFLTLSQASMLLALAGCLVWLIAAVAMARSLARGRAAWAVSVCMLALPASYGAFGTFAYAEPIATPRIFAEAAVLGGLAALVSGRRVLGLALLGLALALHPLMALAGLGVAAVMLVADDRRWLVPFAALVVVLLAAIAFRMPLADRLLAPMDTAWASILRGRSTYLFPRLWPAETFGSVACHLTAVVIAGWSGRGRVRFLLWGAAAVAMAGVATSLAFGDWTLSVLIVQLQTWRALWLLAVLGNASVALAAVALWPGGSAGRLTLALLALTWMSVAVPYLAWVLGAITVLVYVARLRGRHPSFPPRLVLIVGAAAGLLGLMNTYRAGTEVAAFLNSAPAAGSVGRFFFVVAAGTQTYVLVAAALAMALLRPGFWPGKARAGAAVGLTAALVASVLLWDARSSERRMIENNGPAPLARALGSASGEVLWIDGDVHAWTLTGRPAFASPFQGAPTLFSRPLAMEWDARTRDLIALGLARPKDISPWTTPLVREDPIVVSSGAVEAFCRDRRRPAALVAPGAQLDAAPPGWQAQLWRPPEEFHRFSLQGERYHWRTIDVFTVIACPQAGGSEPKL